MRKIIVFLSFALASTLLLSACQKEEAPVTQVQQVQKPSDPNDTRAWQTFLGELVKSNMKGMTASRPYLYFVPAGDDDAALEQRQNQFDNVRDIVLRTVLPGNLMGFGGPDSAKTADLIVGAFEEAKAGSFKGVIVLFIGDEADHQRVADALAASGAEFRFAQM